MNYYKGYDDNEKQRFLSEGHYLWRIPQATMSNSHIIFPSSAVANRFNEKFVYNPFKYYEDPVDEAVIIDCLGSNTKGKYLQRGFLHFHTLFASLYKNVCENDFYSVLKWVHNFGIPSESTYTAAENRCCEKKNYDTIDVPLKDISNEIQRYAFAMEIQVLRKELFVNPRNKMAKQSLIKLLSTELKRKNRIVNYPPLPQLAELELTALRDNAGDYVKELRNTRQFFLQDKEKQINDAPVDVASEALQVLIAINDSSPEMLIHPSSNKLSLNWRCKDAMTALWLMLAFEIESKNFLRRCAAPGCNRFFTATRKLGKYCCQTCQTRAKVAKHRASKKP